MSISITLLNLAGSVALLLWGIHMVHTGVHRAFGAGLRGFLASTLRNRLRAFLAGIGVTAVLQSSTATGLMASGFVAGGVVDLAPALAVMLGANVGSTFLVQVLSFDVVTIAPALILSGVLLFRRASGGLRDFGRVLIGLGLVLMALHQFIALLAQYEGAPTLRLFLSMVSAQWFLDVVMAALLTWAVHSSVAVVLVTMSFAAQNIVSPDAAFALVLGANLGTAINPILEGSGVGAVAKWLPVGNFIIRIVSILIMLTILPYVSPWLTAVEPSSARAVADFHTAFNGIVALTLLPLLTPYSALVQRILPQRIDPTDPSTPVYLDPSAREVPELALGGAAREALRMSDVLECMLIGLRDVFEKANRRQISQTKRMDDTLDKLNTAIKGYLTSIDHESLSEADHARLREILIFATNLEHAGDVVGTNLLNVATKMVKRGVTFSPEGQTELLAMIDRLLINVRTAASLFMTGDRRAARILAAEKESFRTLEADATDAHFDRLRAGRVATAETSTLHLDAVRDLKRVNTHLVAAAAYPVLRDTGELLPNRLREKS